MMIFYRLGKSNEEKGIPFKVIDYDRSKFVSLGSGREAAAYFRPSLAKFRGLIH
jgi:hypothetical protein